MFSLLWVWTHIEKVFVLSVGEPKTNLEKNYLFIYLFICDLLLFIIISTRHLYLSHPLSELGFCLRPIPHLGTCSQATKKETCGKLL